MRYSYGTSPVPHFIWRETDEKVPERATRQPSTLHLLAVGLDTNHGYAQRCVENSEVTKRRAELEQRLANAQRWAGGARVRGRRASRRYVRRCRETKEQAKALYRRLNDHQWELERQGVDDRTMRATIKEEQRVADTEIATYEQRQRRAYEQSDTEYDNCERYCRKQRELLRQVADLAESERAMYELDNAKDQVMTAFKLALANLVLWTRDRYFPATYAHATWHRLEPFFRLPGRIVWGAAFVAVELRCFNDQHLNRDLAAVCDQVNAAQPHLPDGRPLRYTIHIGYVYVRRISPYVLTVWNPGVAHRGAAARLRDEEPL